MKFIDLKRGPRLRWALVIVLAAIALAGAVITASLVRTGRLDFEQDARNETELLYRRLIAYIETADSAALAMSGSPWLPSALADRGRAGRERTDSVLDRYRGAMDLSIAYLMDAKGMTVASSNRKAPDSFVGKSFAFRTYFTEAASGRRGRLFALGAVSGSRGYYSSAPVRDGRGRILGVAAVKTEMSVMEQELRRWPHSYMVSPDGVIFLSSEHGLVYRALWPVPGERREEVALSRQFGPVNYDPVLVHEPLDASAAAFDGADHYVVRIPLPVEGWSVVSLRDAGTIAHYGMFGTAGTLVVCFFAVLVFLALSRAEERRFSAEERRRTAEEQLRSEERWSRTFDAVGDLIAIVDPGHRIRKVNRAMADRLGVLPEEAIGRICHELVHCAEGPVLNCPHDRMLATGERCSIEVAEGYLGGDFLVTASPLYRADGALDGSVHVMHDITERLKRERQIHSLNERLLAIISSSLLAIVIVDGDGTVSLWNPAAERMFGWSEREVLARPLPIVPEDRRAEFLDILEDMRQGRTLVSFVTQRRTRDGRLIDVNLSTSPIRNETGGFQSVLCIMEDITERKRLEAELLTAQKLESVGLLAGGIAHDFNNALNVICGNLSLATMLGGVTGASAEALADAGKACEKAKDLGSRLITFAKGGTPVREPVRVSEVVRDALGFAPRGPGVAFRFEHGPEQVIMADRRQLRQVLINLCSNAAEAMPEGGIVTIGTDAVDLGRDEAPPLPEGRYARITVADTGAGIAPEHLPRIFDPYFSTRERYADRGMGLGLAVCWSVVRKHGGTITAASAVGKGTTMAVYLPAVGGPAPQGG